jgi:hypothetical protein
MGKIMRYVLAATAFFLLPANVLANSLVKPGVVAGIAKSKISASPEGEWNKLKFRPGSKVEIWTLDGPQLNQVMFFGGVEPGQPLFKEADKKRAPLPKVGSGMLITDIPALLESTYRARRDVNRMTIETQEPAVVNGTSGVKFTYRFVRNEDDVERTGEAFGAVKNGNLYLVVYEAPSLHFFERDAPRFKRLLSTIRF